jgi:hypothetical protein
MQLVSKWGRSRYVVGPTEHWLKVKKPAVRRCGGRRKGIRDDDRYAVLSCNQEEVA